MILLFDKLTNKPLSGWGPNTNSLFPEGPPMEIITLPEGYTWDDVKVLRFPDDGPTAQQLMSGDYGSIEHDDVQQALITHPKITITTNKNQIIADNVDEAIITATLPVSASGDETVTFVVAGVNYPVMTANKVATLTVKTTATGFILIMVNSETKYGQNSIAIEGVQA